MATGTGKTRTSLKICKKLLEEDKIDSIIVSADGTSLLEQWYKELLENFEWPILRHYAGHKEAERFVLRPKHKFLLASRRNIPLPLMRLSAETKKRLIIVQDEVHKLGSPSNRENLAGLADNVRFMLGLSATPEREYDQEGNTFIEEHVGPEIFNFPLEEAIRRGVLAPFNYYPLDYELTEEDVERRRAVFALKASRAKEGKPMTDEEFWTRIAFVYKTAEGKKPVFKEFIDQHPEMLSRCIVFLETKEYAEDISEIIHRHRPDFHTYFADDDAETLNMFANGELECLISCHRLSEGIDIRSLQNVILLSSAKARLETIQRMGRCLRRDPENPALRANVIDFIRSDPEAEQPNADKERKAFLQELSNIEAEE